MSLIDLLTTAAPAAGVEGFEPSDMDHRSSKLALDAGLDEATEAARFMVEPELEADVVDIGRIVGTPPKELWFDNDGEGRCIPPVAIPAIPIPEEPIPIPEPYTRP